MPGARCCVRSALTGAAARPSVWREEARLQAVARRRVGEELEVGQQEEAAVTVVVLVCVFVCTCVVCVCVCVCVFV
jgi:hypothetical protein